MISLLKLISVLDITLVSVTFVKKLKVKFITVPYLLKLCVPYTRSSGFIFLQNLTYIFLLVLQVNKVKHLSLLKYIFHLFQFCFYRMFCLMVNIQICCLLQIFLTALPLVKQVEFLKIHIYQHFLMIKQKS